MKIRRKAAAVQDGADSVHPETAGSDSADIDNLRLRFFDCGDFVSQEISVGGEKKVTVCYMGGMTDGRTVSEFILEPLARGDFAEKGDTPASLSDKLLKGAVCGSGAFVCPDAARAELAVLSGCCLVLLGEGEAVAFEARSSEKRSVSEPSVENVVKGSKDAFVESLTTNCALVRGKLRSSGVKLKKLVLGRRSKTQVALMWYEGITPDEVVERALKRLEDIDIDALISTGSIEEYICDDSRTMFPQLLVTERAATFAQRLVDGAAGIIVDGLPMGFTLPVTFSDLMRAPEDRSENYIVASFLGVLRYAALAAALLLPAMYVALASFHQEMIPTKLLLSIIESKQAVPFTTPEEAFILLLAFEILLEAGLRLPKNIGQTVSIIGGIIVGQSAVEAKLASPVMVIIAAASGITGFTLSDQDLASAVRVWRLIFTALAAAGGLFAVAMGAAWFIYRLCAIETFGTPYLSPFSSGSMRRAIKSTVLRPPLPEDKLRPEHLRAQDVRRQR